MITTKQIAEVRRLIEEEGHTCRSAARIVGVNHSTVWLYIHRMGVKMPRKWGPDKIVPYAAYDRKTGQLVAQGTPSQVGEALGVTAHTVYFHAQHGSGPYQIVRLAEPDGEETADGA